MLCKSIIAGGRAFFQWGRKMSINAKSSLSGVASAAKNQHDETTNEDFVGIASNADCGVRAILVADGLKSHAYAKLGAQWAIEEASERINTAPAITASVLREIFVAARARLIAKAASFCAREGITVDKNQSFGTTLIVAVETPSSIIVAYVGNGAIWHIRGSFNEFSQIRYLPWNALNYLNPHSIEGPAGNEEVYRLISFSDNEHEAIPTIIEIEKDLVSGYGDIVMICTDGIYSSDQLDVGRFMDSSIWTKAEPTMLRFFSALNDFFCSSNAETDEALKLALERYISQLRTDGLLDDDASVGVIVTAPALKYQSNRKRDTPA